MVERGIPLQPTPEVQTFQSNKRVLSDLGTHGLISLVMPFNVSFTNGVT